MANLHELERNATASNKVLAQKELDDADTEPSQIPTIREREFTRVFKLTGTISTIRELPNEVIAEIFLHLVLETVIIYKPIDRSLAPWNISQVCSRWREVALSVSTLWNDVDVDFSLADTNDQDILTQKLGMFLSHSGQAPISLCVSAKPPAPSLALLLRLMDILTPYQNRLHHLDLEPAEIIPVIEDFSPNLIKSVKSLELWFNTELRMSPPYGGPLDLTSLQFPALRKVTLALLKPAHVHFHLPWAHLTYLRMDNITFTNRSSHQILSQCRNLVICSLELPNDAALQPENITVMPRLETLRTLTSANRGAYGSFFSLLVAPMLREFTLLSGLDNDIVWSDEALAAFVSHSCVERLVTTASVHKLPTLLQGMPSLLHLIFKEPIDSSTLAAISNGRLFPKLETLVCGGFSDFDKMADMFDEMMDMLEHRSWYSRTTGDSDEFKTLKSMTYCAPRILLLSNTWQERLQKLQADGLHLDWRDEIDISEFDL